MESKKRWEIMESNGSNNKKYTAAALKYIKKELRKTESVKGFVLEIAGKEDQ